VTKQLFWGLIICDGLQTRREVRPNTAAAPDDKSSVFLPYRTPSLLPLNFPSRPDSTHFCILGVLSKFGRLECLPPFRPCIPLLQMCLFISISGAHVALTSPALPLVRHSSRPCRSVQSPSRLINTFVCLSGQ